MMRYCTGFCLATAHRWLSLLCCQRMRVLVNRFNPTLLRIQLRTVWHLRSDVDQRSSCTSYTEWPSDKLHALACHLENLRCFGAANQRFSWSSGAGDTNPKYGGAEEPKVANCWFSVLFVMACATSTSENIWMQTVYRTVTGRVKFCGSISWASEQVLCDIRVLYLTSQVGWFL